MPRWGAAPAFHRLPPSDVDSWGLVIKVEYLGSIKRFNAYVDGSHFDHDLAALRSKIGSAFNFSPDAEFTLTYTDVDGDVVILDDDNDLHDAAFEQKLNPLRIYVKLKSSRVGVPQTKQQVSNSRSSISTALEDQLAQVKSAIDEALKFVPEQVPITLAKLSHDLCSKAAASAPSLAELLDRFAKLLTPKSNTQPSGGHYCLFGSSDDGPQTLGNLCIDPMSEFVTVSASQPSDVSSSESSKALGLKCVLDEDAKAQVEQASIYPLVEDPWISASSAGEKAVRIERTDAHIKKKAHAQSNLKSVISSDVPHVVANVPHVVATLRSAPAPSVSENTLRYEMPFISDGNINRDFHSIFPPQPTVPYCSPLGDNGKINTDLQLKFPPPPAYNYNLPISSVTSHEPHPKGVYSFGGSYRDVDDNYGSVPQYAFHRGIVCDGCEVTPIAGPRYKSNVKDDYDLCSACFSRMGNETEYTRIDMPSFLVRSLIGTKKDRRIIPKLQQGHHDCSFIKNVTVPDGTVMPPSTLFIKVWRVRNNGSAMWPFGTHLIWTGGYQFAAQQSTINLGISVDGFPVNQEINVGVVFIAPANPGRYISHWRMALPSGQKFGQGVSVDIRVESPVQTSCNKQQVSINLNMPPEGNGTEREPFVDMNVEAVELEPIVDDSHNGITGADWPAHLLFPEAIKPKASDPVLNVVPSSTEVEPLAFHTFSTDPVSTLVPPGVPTAPQIIPLSKPISVPAHTSVPVPASAPACTPTPVHAHAPACVLAAPPPDEEKLLRELFHMGFMQVDLNKDILRQDKYDLEKTVDDLCDFHEWDPLDELLVPGSDDSEIN